MSLKELATGFVVGAVTVFLGPTLLSWAGVMLPSLSSGMMPAAMQGYTSYEGDYFGYGGRQMPSRSIGRTVTITPRAAGRTVASHTGNTIGYGGDLKKSPKGAFARLSHPALTGGVSRLNRF